MFFAFELLTFMKEYICYHHLCSFTLPPIRRFDMKIRRYPLSDTFRKSLKTADAPLKVLQLMRDLKNQLRLRESEAEIIFLIATFKERVSQEDICTHMHHLTARHVKRLLNSLTERGLLKRFVQVKTNREDYLITDWVETKILSLG